MASDVLTNIEPFNVHANTENGGVRWQKWLRRFNNFLIAAGITDDTRMEAMLLHCIGEETFDIYCSLPDPPTTPASNLTKYEKAKQKLNNYFVPKINTEFEIYNFRQAKQQDTETIDEYYARLLKLSSNCGFQENEREIKSQIIQYTTYTKLRKYALAENPSLTQLMSQGKAYEAIEKQSEQMKNHTEVVTRIENKPLQQAKHNNRYQENSKKCKNCGNKWHNNGRQACPAANITCHFCNKQGHFAKVCITKQRQEQVPQPGTSKPVSQKHGSKPSQIVKNKRNVNYNESKDEASSDEHSFHLSVNHIDNVPTTSIQMNGQNVNFIIDTGSSVNLISESTFSQLNKQTLSVDTSKIYPYCSTEKLEILGKFTAMLKHEDNKIQAEIHVVKGKCQSLLSYETSKKLNLIKMVTNNISKNIDTQYVITRHPSLCKGIGKLTNCEIKLHIDENIKPIAQKHRRIPFHLRNKVEQELDRLEKQDIIEKAEGATPWISPLVIVPKHNNPDKIRICVDMREANKAICRERHVTPTIDDVISQLNGSVMFSKIDLKDGYHQLILNPESRYITTFSTHTGLYRYKRLSFGINASAEIFQNTISQILSNIPGVINLSDDILIYGNTVYQHNKSLDMVLTRLNERNLTINREKCIFSATKINFFGYIFSKDGIHPDPKKINSIINLPKPANPTEVRSLLGMINYIGKFLPNLAENTKMLRDLTLKNAEWEWNEKHESVFNFLKQQLGRVTNLAYFNMDKPTHLYVDAGPEGLGAILTQENNVIAYASKTLSDAEKRYSQIEKETLACSWTIQHFHIYLYGSNFVLYSDHLPLVKILQNTRIAPNARIERLLLRIQPYKFCVKHQEGKSNPSDYLSRHPIGQCENNSKVEEYVSFLIANSTPKAMTAEEVQEATKSDPTFTRLKQSLKRNNCNWKHPELIPFSKIRQELTVKDNIVLRRTRIVLPPSLQQRAIELAHKGHLGIIKTKQLLRAKVWFPNMDVITEKYIKSCLACQAVTPDNRRDPIISSPLPNQPFEEISVDYAGPFPGNKYVFVLIDEYSRYPLAEITPSTSFTHLKHILEKTFSTFGIPKRLKSDNGPPFNGKEINKFLDQYNIKHTKTTPYWPEANGMAERFIRTLKKSLKCAHLENNQFESQLQQFLLSYRSTPHSTTNKSPFEIVFHREINNLLPMIKKKIKNSDIQRKDKINKAIQKEYADKRRRTKNHNFKVGDIVLCKQTKTNTLTPYFHPDPFKIIKIKGTKIIARRKERVIERNASFFKIFVPIENTPPESNTNPKHTSHRIPQKSSQIIIRIPTTSASENKHENFESQPNENISCQTPAEPSSLRPARLRQKPKRFEDFVDSFEID